MNSDPRRFHPSAALDPRFNRGDRDRIMVEEALRESEQRFRSAFDDAPIGMALMALDGRFVQVNRALCDLFGYTQRELQSLTFRDITHPLDLSTDLELASRLVAGEIARYSLEKRYFDKHGRVVWALLHVSMVRGDGGEPLYGIAQIKDINDAKQAEKEREDRAAQLRALAEAAVSIGGASSVGEIAEVMTRAARGIIGARIAITRLRSVDSVDEIVVSKGASSAAVPDIGDDTLDRWTASGSVGIPLTGRDGKILGVLQLSNKETGELGHEDVALGVQLAQLASRAIENVRLLGEITAARTRLEGLSRRLVNVQEEERRTLSRELHDEVGQILTGMKLMLETGTRPGASVDLIQIRDLASQLYERVRDISLSMRPPMLDDLGLVATLLWHFERYRRQTGVEVRFHHRGVNGRLAAETEIAAFRIIQEALTNVARHAQVTEVTVELWTRAGLLVLRVEDEGRGFDPAPLSGLSGGLTGMRERAELVGGRLVIESSPAAGTRLSAELPL